MNASKAKQTNYKYARMRNEQMGEEKNWASLKLRR